MAHSSTKLDKQTDKSPINSKMFNNHLELFQTLAT
jgi:hypothetical protein